MHKFLFIVCLLFLAIFAIGIMFNIFVTGLHLIFFVARPVAVIAVIYLIYHVATKKWKKI